jgi:hypothetical protein
MDKINFTNYPSTDTPISADNLNLLQTNVENAIPTSANEYGSSQTAPYSQNYINTNVGVVESGSNSNGSYIKYSDGTMICYKIVTGTTNISTAWGNGYTSGADNSIYLGNFAAEFISKPIVNVTLERGSSNCWLASNINVGTISAGIVSLLRFTMATNVAYTLNVIAIGKWK